MDFRVSQKAMVHLLTGMDPSSIPDQKEGTGNMVLKMFQSLKDLLTVDRSFKMPFVDFTRESKGHRRRQNPTIPANLSQDRSPSSTGPGRRRCFLKREPKFIPEDDFGAQPLRLFLSWVNRGPARPAPTLVPVPPPAARVAAHYILADPGGD